jgi:hypothetical protein
MLQHLLPVIDPGSYVSVLQICKGTDPSDVGSELLAVGISFMPFISRDPGPSIFSGLAENRCPIQYGPLIQWVFLWGVS